jgi:uncharacterized membrane protein YkoI
MTFRILLLASVAFLGLSSPVPAVRAAHAQIDWTSSWSPNQARDARERGQIRPLKEIFRDLKRRYGGYQLNAELYASDDGSMEYRVSWLTEDGRKIDLVVDAATGEIKSSRGA